MAIKKWILIAALFLAGMMRSTGSTQKIEIENIPDEALEAVEQGPFAQSYSLDGTMNPFYLRGDFDGDGKADYAFRIKSKHDGALGIGIWLSSQRKFIILGAGVPFLVAGSKASDLSVLNTWQVYDKKTVERGVEAGSPPRFIGEAILVGKRESASGLIYWTGKRFVWYQQGD
jgi:hypothetical protein